MVRGQRESSGFALAFLLLIRVDPPNPRHPRAIPLIRTN